MKLTVIAIVLMAFSFSFGQIEVTSDDLLGLIGKSLLVESDTSGFIYISPGPGGENQLWDFSSVVLQKEIYHSEFIEPQNSCCADSFPQSNFVNFQYYEGLYPDSAWIYFQIIPSSIFIFGVIEKEEDSTLVTILDEEAAPLPLRYGQTWITVNTDTIVYGEGIDQVVIILKDSTFTTVDAWGTLTTPAGIFECLRLRDNNTEYSHNFFYAGEFSDTSTNISYDWVTKNNFLAASMQSQDGETDPNFSIAQEVEILKSTAPTSITDEHLTGPRIFELFHNYPNPFNPETVIKFQMSQPENVRIDVYDINGKWITTLVDGQKSAGSYSTLWNGKNNDGLSVASGIYYYTLFIAGNNVQSRKMTLIR